MITKTIRNSNTFFIFFLMMALSPLGQMSIDFYSTSIPQMALDFKISENIIDLITISYMFSYGIGQIFHGNLCDILGRKRLLIIFMPFYILSTLYAPFCTSSFSIIFMRFIQGFSIASVSVTVKSITADIFNGNTLTKAISSITIIWGLSPILAPLLGSFIQTYYGWHGCFYFLGLISLILYINIIFFIPETLVKKNNFNIPELLMKYNLIIKNKIFWMYMIQINLAIIGLLAFIIQTPYLIQNVYKITPIGNGILTFFISLIYLLGTQQRRFDNVNYFVKQILILIFSFCIYLSNLYINSNEIIFITSVTVIMFVCGNLLPSNVSKCLQIYPNNTGIISGLIGFITIIVPGTLFAILTFLNINSNQKYAYSMLFYSLFSVLISMFLMGYKKHIKIFDTNQFS